MAEAKNCGRQIIEGLSLSPSRLLYLARKFAVHQWVQSCVETLIPVCGSLDNDEALAPGPITLNIITRAKAEIDKERIGTAFTPGKLKNVKTLSFGEGSCIRLIPQNGDTLAGLTIKGMTPKRQIEGIALWSTVFINKEHLIAHAVAAVRQFHKFYRAT
ncbi:hypothetical protein R3P38DRAFT_3183252 [Favolaschia claudopus]|uniref:Uncharacterized protein n=1 Tax=Favolaschia claudopus TaxID=2862362 RepID=A0AAW0CDX6_9AGAR